MARPECGHPDQLPDQRRPPPEGLATPGRLPRPHDDTSAGAWTIEPHDRCEAGSHSGAQAVRGLDRRRARVPVRRLGSPAPTLLADGLAKGATVWVHDRPATTVQGDPRVQPPGHKRNRHDPPGRYPSRSGDNGTVRVTVEQAAILQGFRPDYPWQGARTAQFRQIGNAVCPPLVRRVLDEAMRPTLTRQGEL